MHLAERAYILVVLTAILAIAGIWSVEPAFSGLWRWPAALLLAGAALESIWMRRTPLEVDILIPARAFLGRPQTASFAFRTGGTRALRVEYAPVVPPGFEGPNATRVVFTEPASEARGWRDPWVALAASEREARAASLRALLRRLGAPVVAAREELLERAVLAEYEALRRSRRI